MRKIEEQMWAAIVAKRNWSGENTTVTIATGATHASVSLHGNHIADVFYSAAGYPDGVEVDERTLARWPTATTKSRLRALGVQLEQRDFTLYLNGKALA